MNYEYTASGNIDINKNTQSEVMVKYYIKYFNEFITISEIYIPMNKVIHTGKYSILLNGGMATGEFNNKIFNTRKFKDRDTSLSFFNFGSVI